MKKIISSPAAPLPVPLRMRRLRERAGDRLFRLFVMGFGGSVIVLAGAIFWQLIKTSHLAWQKFGLPFIWTSVWDPVNDVYGALPFIYGTVVSSAIALAIAVPLGLGSALFLAEMAPKRLSSALTFLIELLAAIPSVILGLMGIFILVPAVKAAEPFLIKTLGFLPFFRGTPYGVGMLTAGLILSIMILPYITTISRDVILSVPRSLKEGALALGATHWETVRLVILPFSRSAIFGAIFLALGRALGETMAVTMVIGNTPKISLSLLDPAYTMSAVLANEFAEATSDLHVHSLISIALILFCMTIVVNGLARLLIYQVNLKGAKQ
jgi:phosphate transport system permease protein